MMHHRQCENQGLHIRKQPVCVCLLCDHCPDLCLLENVADALHGKIRFHGHIGFAGFENRKHGGNHENGMIQNDAHARLVWQDPRDVIDQSVQFRKKPGPVTVQDSQLIRPPRNNRIKGSRNCIVFWETHWFHSISVGA